MDYFKKGVEIDSQVYNQERVQKRNKIQNLCRFFSTNTVSKLIFEKLIQKKPIIFMGSFGIGKTSSIILFIELTKQVNRLKYLSYWYQINESIYGKYKQQLNMLQKLRLIGEYPKYWYWSVKSTLLQKETDLIRVIYCQLKQLGLSDSLKMQSKQYNSLEDFILKIKKLHRLILKNAEINLINDMYIDNLIYLKNFIIFLYTYHKKLQFMSKMQAVRTQISPALLKQSPKQCQKEMIDHLDRDNIHKYLKGIQVTSLTEQMSRGIIRSSAEKIVQGLKKGLLHIPKNPPPLPDKNSHPFHLSSEEMRDLQNRTKRQMMAKKIDYLYEQIRGESPKERQQSGNLHVDFKEILTKEEHQRRMREIVQDKLQRKKRMAQLQEEQQRKRKEEEQRQQAMKKLQQEKEREMKRIKIQENIKKRKQQHDKSLQMKSLLQKQLEKAKKSSRLYEQMQERYKSQILLPSLEEKKNKLKEIRDFHKRYNVETIKDHQKQYIQKSLEKSRQRRENSPQWKYEPPSRTERLSKLLKDEQIMLKQQLQFRRKKLDQMQKRQQLYRMQLKEKHQPIVDEEKRREIEQRLIREKRKYDRTHPDIDKKRLGQAYLEIAKRLKRPQSVKEQHEKQQGKLLKQKQQSQPLLPKANHTQQFYEQMRRKKIENIINSQQKSVSEKFMMLKMQSQKLGEKLKQKEELMRYQGDEQAKNDAAQLLLSSIKAKMGIMDILKQNRNSTEEST